MRNLQSWVPAGLLGVGLILMSGVNAQSAVPLRAPLPAVIPGEIQGYVGKDLPISEEEQRVAGMTNYLMRVYSAEGAATAAAAAPFSLYVGYYESQVAGKTIHSPKNCLPGAGWEALTSSVVRIATAAGTVPVNRFLLQKGNDQAVVLYWYQGRGRVAANEYGVKWDLLRDAALRGRSEEALVRIIVPVTGSEEEAFRLASSLTKTVIPSVGEALPV